MVVMCFILLLLVVAIWKFDGLEEAVSTFSNHETFTDQLAAGLADQLAARLAKANAALADIHKDLENLLEARHDSRSKSGID